MPVAVRDLASGEENSRPHDTPTLDVPDDFPWSGVLTVADGFRASYLASDGKQVVHSVVPMPLGWRAKGETCLIARTGAARRHRQDRLCRVTPAAAPAVLPSSVECSPGPADSPAERSRWPRRRPSPTEPGRGGGT